MEKMNEILPLGSVVEIGKEIKMVITHRFLYSGENGESYDYAGVPYPVGMEQADQIVLFNCTAIVRVIHKGYSDELEEELVSQILREEQGEEHGKDNT